MRKWQRLLYSTLALFCFIAMIWIILNTSPHQVLPIQSVLLPFSWLLYTALFGFCLFLSKAISARFIHGTSLGIFIVALLLLKTNNLFQPFLIVLLVILVAALEVAFFQRRKKNHLTPQ